MKILLDTHIWIWLAEGNKKLSMQTVAMLDRHHGQLALSAISIWEFAMLVYNKRLSVDCPPDLWVAKSLANLNIGLIPIDAEIALESYDLPGEFHNDPADRMIIATARKKGLSLLTQDKAILTYAKRGHVILK